MRTTWVAWLVPLLPAFASAGEAGIGPGGSGAALASGLHSDGKWIRDDAGRVALLRGMSYSGLEFGNFPGDQNGPEEADFAQMESWGVDVVRVPIAWSYLEPAPNAFDESYLTDHVDPVVGWAAAHGIGVVFDMHQYLWSECVGGLGAPGWSCDGSRYPPPPLGAFYAQADFWNNAFGPDGRPLLYHLLDAWSLVARHYAAASAVIGFDLFNEPFGMPQTGTFEHEQLYPFYRKAIGRIRAEGALQTIFLEPPITRNAGVRAHPEPVGDADIVYAPHLYTETWGDPSRKYDGDRAAVDSDYAQSVDEAAEQGAVLFAGELGGSTDPANGFLASTELFLRHSAEEQEERRVGGAFWAYFPGDNVFSIVDADGHEKGELVDLFSRPYPARTAGIPHAILYDPDLHDLRYWFLEDPQRAIPDPTVIYVPIARHYGAVLVEVSPGDTAIVDAARSRVLVSRDRSSRRHFVHLRPAP